MLRKGWQPTEDDMTSVVAIHNAVNERAWREILAWEAAQGGAAACGGPRLVKFRWAGVVLEAWQGRILLDTLALLRARLLCAAGPSSSQGLAQAARLTQLGGRRLWLAVAQGPAAGVFTQGAAAQPAGVQAPL